MPTPADRSPGRPWRLGTPPPTPIGPDPPSADIRIGYARCSILGQELDCGLDALGEHGVPRGKVFSERSATGRGSVRSPRRHCGRHGRSRCAPRAFFAAMAENGRENIRESTLEGLDTAARKGKHGGRSPVITEDMLHTVLRRRANGESVEQIQPDLIIPTGKRKDQNPPCAGIYRALAELAKFAALLISLLGTTVSRKEKLVAAWLGPKGFASVVYGLLAVCIRRETGSVVGHHSDSPPARTG
nr:recombinase family protein [Streptomyces roseirectus]